MMSRSSNPALEFVPLASLPGEELDPAFSPDGGYVAFSYSPDGAWNLDLYVKAVGAGDPLRLTNTPESERYPQWSPDSSQLAFLRWSDSGVGVWVMGALGGGEREIATVNWSTTVSDTAVAWSRTGDSLIVADRHGDQGPYALYTIHLETGSKRRLTDPPPDTLGDANPSCSPDGQMLAFTRQSRSRVMDIWVMPMSGGEPPRRVTSDQRLVRGLAWTADGKHLAFLSDRGDAEPGLWKVPSAGGRPQSLAVLPVYSRMVAVAWRTGRIAYARTVARSSIWRYDLGKARPGARKPDKLITSSRTQAHPQYSPDGTSIAFMSDRSGSVEIWVARSDGSNPRQLTQLRGPEGGAPRWSPDGKLLAFDMRVQSNPDIFVVGGKGGPLRHLVAGPSEDGAPSWSRDGRWVYFWSNRTGSQQVWKIPASGGSPVQVTRDGGLIAFESPDGAVLYYAKGREQPGLWKKTLPGGEEVAVLPDYGWAYLGSWQVTGEGVCFMDTDNTGGARSLVVRLLPHGGGAGRILTTLDKAAYPAGFVGGGVARWHSLAAAPDGKYLLVTQVDHRESNIMIAEGFR